MPAFAYIILDEPQLCVWDTAEEANIQRELITDSRTSDIFEINDQQSPSDWYQTIDDCMRRILELQNA